MSWITTIGSKLKGLPKLGAKFLRGAANIGSKASGMANKFLDAVENTPYIGNAVQKIPGYNTGREVVRSVGLASDLARQGANVLDQVDRGNYTKAFQDAKKTGSDIEKTYTKQKDKMKSLNYT